MRKLICIVCPKGCHLEADEGPSIVVRGNACPRGAVYAREEMTAPKRTVTATCRADIVLRQADIVLRKAGCEKTADCGSNQAGGENPADGADWPADLVGRVDFVSRAGLPRRVPVRTSGRIPKGMVESLVRELSVLSVSLPVRAGDIVIENWADTGVSVVVTRDIGL